MRAILCHQCYIGRLTPGQAPYLSSTKEGILIAPRVPALVCDHCDYIEYDPAVIQRIAFLLRSPNPHPKTREGKPVKVPIDGHGEILKPER